MIITTLKQARKYGTITIANSKMPGSCYATNPLKCNVGSKLVDIEGSVCHKCYAVRIVKRYPHCIAAWERNRIAMLCAPRELWIESMVFQIEKAASKTGEPYHR